MTTEPTCPRCSRVLSPDDIVELASAGIVHVDCRHPRDLTPQELSLFYAYCWAHPISCPRCAHSGPLFELGPPLEHRKRTRCPRCQAELIETVRDHLYTCRFSPAALRHNARETRETARRLVKQSRELRDRADVLMREAEAAVTEFRNEMQPSAREALRRRIRAKLLAGSLPHDDISASIPFPGRRGDGSTCSACGQSVGPHQLMMVIAWATTPTLLHADCFSIWSEERRTFNASS